MAGMAQRNALDEPNNLEAFLGNTIGKLPFLPSVLDYVARPFFATANVADAAVMALQGRGGEALERLGDAGRNLASLLPFVDNPTMEQRRTFKDVLTSAGVGDLGVADLPLIGKVSGKGALGLGLDVFAAGRLTPRIGARLPVAPRTPVLRNIYPQGGLALGKRGFERTLGAVPSTLAAEAEIGSRALVSMFNRPILKDLPIPGTGGTFLELVDLTRRGLAKTIFSPFTKARGLAPEFSRFQEGGRHGGISKMIASDENAVGVMQELEAFAKAKGVSPDDLFDSFLLGTERGGARAAQRARRADIVDRLKKAEAEAADFVPGDKKDLALEKVNRYRNELNDFERSLRVAPGKGNPARQEFIDTYREYKDKNGPYKLTTVQARNATMMHLLNHVDKDMAPIAAGFLDLFRANIRNEIQAGIAISHVADPFLNYVTRTLKPEAVEAIERAGLWDDLGGVFEKWYAKNGSAVRRKAVHEGMPIPEINDFVRTHLPDVFAEGIFETNPLKIALARSRRMARSISTADFVGGTIGHYGRAAHPALKAAGWKSTEEILAEIPRTRLTLERGFKGVNGEPVLTRLGQMAKGRMVPADVAEALVETIKTMTNPKTANNFIALYDQLTRTFKLGATALFPEFHVRNGVSNFWANYLAGVRGIKPYTDALRAMRGDSEALIDLGNGISMTAEEFFKRLKEHGLTGRHHSMLNPGEVAQGRASILRKPRVGETVKAADRQNYGKVVSIDKDTGRARVHFVNPDTGEAATVSLAMSQISPIHALFPKGENAVVSTAKLPGRVGAIGVRGAAQAGLKAGTAVEDWAKVAHVIDRMRSGMSLPEAVYSAKKFLFDYADLTSFEKTFMRRIVPFYTWSRKNLPLQLESLFTEPGKVAQAGLVMRALQNGHDGEPVVDTTMVPQWMRRRFWGASKHDDDSISLFSGLGIGLEDLAIFDRPVAEFMAMLNPLVKAPLQAATNRDFFRDTELDRAEIAPSVLKHFGLAPGGRAFLDAIGFREVKNDAGEPKYARANPRFLNFLRGIFEVGGISRAINTVGSIGADRPTAPAQPLKFLTALRVQHSDTRQQMKQHMITLLEAYRDRLEELRRQGVTEEFKSFFVERDLVDDTPEVKEAKALIRELGKVGKALRTINSAGPPVINEMAVDVRRSSLRGSTR